MPHSIDISFTRQLARQLETDIQQRGLREGDRYLTAAEAAKLLGVSVTSSHRALSLLSERHLVVRRRGQGTYVGPAAGRRGDAPPRAVHVLLPAESREVHELPLNVLACALREQFAEVNVELNFIPAKHPTQYLQRQFAYAEMSPEVPGVVAISCPGEVYRYLASCGLPAAVLGSPYPGRPVPPWIDGDHFQAGRLLAGYLIGRGHARIAVVMPDVGRPGQRRFVEGVLEALAEAGIPPKSLEVRGVRHEQTEFGPGVVALLKRSDRPTALILSKQRYAEEAMEAIEKHGLSVPDDVEIAFREPTVRVRWSPFAHTQPQWEFEEVAERAAEMLGRLCRGEPLEQNHVIVPMELHQPSLSDPTSQ